MNNARNSTAPYFKVFATRLREVMDAPPKTTQEMLAKETGLTRQSISTYMDGSVLPNTEKLQTICKYFNVPSDYLIGLTNSKSKDVTDQHIKDTIGLSDKAINQLRIIYKESARKLFPTPPSNIDFLNYMLSNQNFMVNFTERLKTYLLKRLADNDNAEKTKKIVTSEETDTASYLLTRLMQKLADDCYSDFYYPIARGKKANQKPGRKRKEDVTNGNNEDE